MVCKALSNVVVDTCWECCAAERTAVGVEEPEMVDRRFDGSMAGLSRRKRLKFSLLITKYSSSGFVIISSSAFTMPCTSFVASY